MTTKNIKYLNTLDKMNALVVLLKKHRRNPSVKLMSLVESELAKVEADLNNSYYYLLEPETVDLLIGKIHFMMNKTTDLSKKYEKQKFTGR